MMLRPKIKNSSFKRIFFITFSDFESGTNGESVNDRKLFQAIPDEFFKFALYPKYSKNKKVKVSSFFKFFTKYLKIITISHNILITRGIKLSIIPLFFQRLFKNKIILNLGCSPMWLIERKAWESNIEFKSNKTILHRFYHFIEPQLEKYALRKANQFIVENVKAKKIINFYGAGREKIYIIPYYVQEYFLNGENPIFNSEYDTFTIGYTGRFRGYDLIVPVINAIDYLKKYIRIKLYLIGDGPQKEKIEKLVAKKSLKNEIIFLGAKPHKEVSRLIEDYHCLILPMLKNLCPSTIAIKILEGVIKKKIIITTNSGNNASLFLNNTELIIKKCTSKNIAEKIRYVIKNYEKLKLKAEKLSIYHKRMRSIDKAKEKLDLILSKFKNNNINFKG